jgi:hypothetical protein
VSPAAGTAGPRPAGPPRTEAPQPPPTEAGRASSRAAGSPARRRCLPAHPEPNNRRNRHSRQPARPDMRLLIVTTVPSLRRAPVRQRPGRRLYAAAATPRPSRRASGRAEPARRRERHGDPRSRCSCGRGWRGIAPGGVRMHTRFRSQIHHVPPSGGNKANHRNPLATVSLSQSSRLVWRLCERRFACPPGRPRGGGAPRATPRGGPSSIASPSTASQSEPQPVPGRLRCGADPQ